MNSLIPKFKNFGNFTGKHRMPQKEELIKGLNGDLAREYKTIIQYVVFSSTLKGAQYGNIAEQLREHASEELKHAILVAEQVDYLGGTPIVEPAKVETSDDSRVMLELDLKAEQETIRNYGERIKQAQDVGEFGIASVLYGIIRNEQDHAIDLKDALGA